VDPFLVADGVSKRFPGVIALDSVHFDLRPSEVHVLLGENGAGKSTLVKILSGAYRPDAGEVRIDGQPVRVYSPSAARRAGISTVYQELALATDMTVAQNIFLGREEVRGWANLLDKGTMRVRTRDLLQLLDLDVDPDEPVRHLSIAKRQGIEIVRALAWKSRALIMDEPTSSLSSHETDELFSRIGRLTAEGVGVIYISHRLEEIERIADRMTVMRDGRVIATLDRGQADQGELIRLMVGRQLSETFPRRETKLGEELLRIEGLSVSENVHDVSFSVCAGEVLGIAGLVGAGRTETLRAIIGLDASSGGRIFVRGQPVAIHTPRDALAARIGLVPEDRHGQGLVLLMSVQQNITLASLEACLRRGFLAFGVMRDIALRYIGRLRIKVSAPSIRVGTLSGGNQQKVVIARALAAGSDIVLLDEPTRGIDVGAKAEIYELVAELAAEGKAIVLVSSELPEVLGLADRIMVMREGRVSRVFDRAEATQEMIMAAALPTEEAA
jgi:ribose transport system ATP-binding protein